MNTNWFGATMAAMGSRHPTEMRMVSEAGLVSTQGQVYRVVDCPSQEHEYADSDTPHISRPPAPRG